MGSGENRIQTLESHCELGELNRMKRTGLGIICFMFHVVPVFVLVLDRRGIVVLERGESAVA
jgi:hypothetical protein